MRISTTCSRATALLAAALISGTTAIGSASAQQTFVSLGTASAGGTYYLIGAGIAQVVSRNSDLRVVPEATAGSVENVNLVTREKLDIGMSSFLVIPQVMERRDLSNLRVIATGHSGPLHWFVRQDSDIQSMDDIRGKRVSVGAPGSGHNVAVNATLEHGLGISPEEIEPAHLNIPETVSAIKDGTIDVGTIASTTPVPALLELSTTVGIRFLDLSAAAQEEVAEATDFVPGTIEAGTYPGQEEEVRVMYFTPAVLHTHDNVPDEVAYSFIKALYENPDQIKAVHPQAAFWTTDFVFRGAKALAAVDIPFHPGVVRYLKEADLWDQPDNPYLGN